MIDVLAVSIALLAVLVAAAVYSGQSRRTDFEAARTLHLDLTSGEVADARRLLGTLRYGGQKDRDSVSTSDALTAYFTVLWCFERIAAGRRMMLRARLLERQGRAVKFLDESIHWHLHEWRVGLPVAKQLLAQRMGVPIDDNQSRGALRELLQSQDVGPMQDEMSQ